MWYIWAHFSISLHRRLAAESRRASHLYCCCSPYLATCTRHVRILRNACCGRAGEEITHRYSWSIERNDKSMMNYFFVHQRSPPRLCAADLPGGSVWDDKEQTPPEDDVGSQGGIPVSEVNLSESTHCTG